MLPKLLLRTGFVFIVLFTVTLPFPLSFFPSVGEWLQPCFQGLNQWSAAHIFGIRSAFTSHIESDSTGFYIHLFHLLLFSIVLGSVWLKYFKKSNETRLQYLFNTTATYVLAFFLLKYGFDKVFKAQFYLPEPNTLYTPLGMLSKDILFWSTVGSSYSYSLFSGLMEVIPAFLLFHRKTRLLGGLIAFGVLLHVLVINFSFDISVKILSAYLLFLSLVVISPYLKSLFQLFVREQSHFPRPEIETVNRNKNALIRFLKAGIIACMLFECLYTYVETNNFNDDLVQRPKYHGAYNVVKDYPMTDIYVETETSAHFGNLQAIQRIFVHRRGYLIFQYADDSMKDFPAFLNFHSNQMTVKTHLGLLKIEVKQVPETNTYYFYWYEGQVKHQLVTQKTDLRKLPLLQNDFIWSIDAYKSR